MARLEYGETNNKSYKGMVGGKVTIKNNPRCSVQEVLDKLATLPGCQPMSPLFKLGIRLFTKKANRETFVALSELEYQLKWLKDQQDNI
ncbi:hypothetical protein WN944_018276 [Citrus x changshan-huyou]|uniref:Uncharacterized protein n=1 Tax=Citrus x changshan-huyou TaxID=2935761 RepID=A0AAP0QD09_9ROSI